jgi:hypothetical protein
VKEMKKKKDLSSRKLTDVNGNAGFELDNYFLVVSSSRNLPMLKMGDTLSGLYSNSDSKLKYIIDSRGLTFLVR